MARFTIFADACLLYSAPARDLLLECAARNLFQIRWSDDVHAEWIDNLLRNRPDIAREQLEHTRALMEQAFPDARVSGHEALEAALSLPDEGDLHVLAAAIKGRADMIVTFNTRDFPPESLSPWDMECRHPDDFFIDQFHLNQALFLEAVKTVRGGLKKPPLSVTGYLEALVKNGLAGMASLLREYDQLI